VASKQKKIQSDYENKHLSFIFNQIQDIVMFPWKQQRLKTKTTPHPSFLFLPREAN